MAIQPIDLQTLFTQMDKVGKTQMSQREGLAVQQAIQGTQLQRKIDEQIQSVNETQNTGEDGAEKIKDRGPQTHDSGGKKKQDTRQEDTKEPDDSDYKETQARLFRDPRLGRNIDISL